MHSSPAPAPQLPPLNAPPLPVTPSQPSQQPNAAVIVSVIVVCTAFLLISYCKVLKRVLCCSLNPATMSRNQVQGQGLLLHEGNNPDDVSLQMYSHGLDFSIIQSLPMSQFRKKKMKKNKEEEEEEEEEEGRPSNTECAICLGEFEEGEWLRHLPSCAHAFHISCIDTWFESHSNCPLCRSNVDDLTFQQGCSVSVYTLLDTLRREDFFHERAAHYQILRGDVLQNLGIRYQPIEIHAV